MSMPRKIRCAVEAVTDHGGRVYTVDLKPDLPVPAFRPGQFLHLTVDAYDPASFWPESRVFSIASSPRERGRIRICYSVKGRYTTKMEQTLRGGSAVWVKLPYGEFVIDDGCDAVLIAGGTGLSAFTAFVDALKPDLARRVTLVYGARTPDLFLSRDMLLARQAAVPNFQAVFFAEASADRMAGASGAGCFAGRISLDTLWREIESPAARTYYLSGPPVMLQVLGAGLKERGVAPDRIRTDAWE